MGAVDVKVETNGRAGDRVVKPRPLIIVAGRTEGRYWQDLWRYRELVYILTRRDVLVRYKQTVIGVAWALVRPFLTMVVLTVVFGRLSRLPAEGGAAYPLLVFAGLLPWNLFSSAMSAASTSLVGNATLISKVYFPRLIIPLAATLANLVDFLVSGAMLVILMAVFGQWPSWHVVFLPFFTLLALAVALGGGLWLGALNVRYRDFGHITPFLVQFGLYLSPVGFSSAVVPAEWRLVYSLNPAVGIIDGFRWSLLPGDVVLYWPGMAVSLLSGGLLLASGLWYFRKTERTFADVI